MSITKLLPSDNPLCNLVANCLGQVDVPFFLNSIKAIDQNSNDNMCTFDTKAPSFVNKEILNTFKDIVIGKTPAWVIAYCLEVLSSSAKKYSLNCCAVSDLSRVVLISLLVTSTRKKDILS